jgi:hypothetical protein
VRCQGMHLPPLKKDPPPRSPRMAHRACTLGVAAPEMRPPVRRPVEVKIQPKKAVVLKRRWMKKNTHSHKRMSV